ncbi:MAG: family 2 encapsulin nanocompartment cargo protein terpene cyclase [Acidimicrobiia bacterium]
MPLLDRRPAPATGADVAGMVSALLSSPERPAPPTLLPDAGEAPLPRDDGPAAPASSLPFALPGGIGTSAVRVPRPPARRPPDAAARRPPDAAARLGTSAMRLLAGPGARPPGEALYCPPAVRDDVALGEAVNDRLVEWAEEVGVYPGQLDKVRAADFGRLVMLTHPATDDPDRLLAAGKCILAEWATDDHFLDDESIGADATAIAARLGVTYAAVDPTDLPVRYAPQLDRALDAEPVAVAYRSAIGHLARYATATQLARLRHELAVMFLAYNHEANWRTSGRVPPVWEYLTHRHENSFLPPMVLVDAIAGYEVPAWEFADRRVRRAFCLAGTASVVLNDLYSRTKEQDADFDLPKLIAAEEGCSAEEAVERTVCIHNELMHTFVAEASVLSQLGSVELRRFLADLWAWLGGSREWHSTTGRYHAAGRA